NFMAAITTTWQILPGSASSISKSCYWKSPAGPPRPASRRTKGIDGTRRNKEGLRVAWLVSHARRPRTQKNYQILILRAVLGRCAQWGNQAGHPQQSDTVGRAQ